MQVKVQSGDTLYKLLREQGVPEGQLRAAADKVAEVNQLESPDLIHAGTTLELPDTMQIGGETIAVGQHASVAQDFVATAQTPATGQQIGAMGQFAFQTQTDQPPRPWDKLVNDLYQVTEPNQLRQVIGEARGWLAQTNEGADKRTRMTESIDQAEAYLASPPKALPGRYEIPGSGRLDLDKDGTYTYFPPTEDLDALAQIEERCTEMGFTFPRIGDGWMYLPRDPETGDLKPGEYQVTDDLMIYIQSKDEVWLYPTKDETYEALYAQGCVDLGETAMVGLPSFDS